MDETSNTNESVRSGGIKDFIAQTNIIGNVIAAAASQKNSFEPLPFSNSSLFEETYDQNQLRIHINPHSSTKYVFLPKVKINVSVTAERKHGPHIFHPYIYTLKFTHDKFKWEAIRSYKEIKEMHKTLAKMVKQDIGRSCSDISKDDIKDEWPLFPTEHDHLISSSLISERCKHLAEYLQRLLTYPPFRDHPSTLQLLGVSPLSFIKGLSSSLKEEIIYKRSGDNTYYGHLNHLKLCCEKAKILHTKRWFILKDTYLIYLNSEQNNLVGFAMLIDRAFECELKHKVGAYRAIEIKNLQRNLVLKCKSPQQQEDWYKNIKNVMRTTGRQFYDETLLPNGSFAPFRKNQLCRWYVNAAAYMEHVMNALNNAKEEIYITDWWLCPELFLKRPTDDLQYRLDKILLKKSKEGVKIYILLFKEVSLAIGLLSSRAKNILTQAGKNTNIRVLRHPEHSPSGVFLWSHHEKCVIIDQSVAFMGGIDLCFGRWDDDLHRLIDLGRRENKAELDPPNNTTFSNIANVANEIQKLKNDDEPNKDRSMLRTDTENKLEDSKDDDKKAKTKSKEVENQLCHLIEQQKQLEAEKSNNPNKPDALIVAALMGNSIIKFSRARNNRIQTQLSAPPISSPVFQPDTPTHSGVYEKPSLDKSKSFSDHGANAIELNVVKPDDLSLNIENEKNCNNSSVVSKANTSANNKKTNNQLNTSNLSNKRFGSKASKYTNVPTDPNVADEVDNDLSSKKEKVKRKWNKFKKTVKRKSHQNPLNKLRRRSTGSDSDEYSEYTESDDEQAAAGARNSFNEEIAQLPVISNEGYYWIGKDYSNSYKADFKDLADFSSDQFNRTQTPRMPWRDQGLVIFGESARDLARHFIQRWNQCKREKVRQIASYPFLIPKSYTDPFEYNYDEWFKDTLYKCEIQMTRSLDYWSGGISKTECSILNSYCDLIKQAEHYIYIENQFFVTTSNSEKDDQVKNTIGKELVNKIYKAHQDKKKFRVYVVLPLLPGFDSLNAIQAVQYFNLRSIKFGEYSIYRELQKLGIKDPSEYITFHGMRNWSVLMGKLVQEIIYVHSKLMIVDDKYVICGSANINDRSLLGKRDSEIAAVIKDEEFFESVLNNQKVYVGKYANSLRKKIFKLHLGIYYNNPNKIEVQDCVCDEFYNYFLSVSKQNTITYDEVFKCLPSDNIINFEVLTSYGEKPCLSKTDPNKGKEELDTKVKGFIVDFPLKFLSQEKHFFPDIRTPEGMVPTAMWT